MSTFSRRVFLATVFGAALATLAPAFGADFTSGRISVTTEGQGSDVVLIPGLGSSPRVWREMVRAVPGYRYHIVHVAGFAGRAPEQNTQGFVAAPVAEEVARYIAERALVRPAVIGHSMGGTIGLMIAARHPDALSKLMVLDMVPFLGALFGPPGTTADSIRPVADAIKATMNTPDPVARQVRSSATLAGMIDNVAMREGALDDSMTSDQELVARAMHELVVTDLRGELPRIGVPVTVLYVTSKGPGMSDAAIDAGYRQAYAPIRNVTLERIAASAHFMMWDQPEQFQAEVRTFLGRPAR
ncbi:alpha/beta fold hydrolase [Massilia sp. TSP1-1-2]|uniref:alpha/beta fold hydrolase n=1 Tax=Massilia sp. TSP1-1-2 TaxID=2804649 RepID=UPI003CE67F94